MTNALSQHKNQDNNQDNKEPGSQRIFEQRAQLAASHEDDRNKHPHMGVTRGWIWLYCVVSKGDAGRYSDAARVCGGPASKSLRISRPGMRHGLKNGAAKTLVLAGVIEAGDHKLTGLERIALTGGNWQRPTLDCRLSVRVEDMKPGRTHGNAQLVTHLHPNARLDTRHHDVAADLHIEQDF